MHSTNCECGHEKRDHRSPLLGTYGYGACKVCLCGRYAKVTVRITVAEKSGVGAGK